MGKCPYSVPEMGKFGEGLFREVFASCSKSPLPKASKKGCLLTHFDLQFSFSKFELQTKLLLEIKELREGRSYCTVSEGDCPLVKDLRVLS